MWCFLKDLEIEIPFDPAIPLLGIYPKDYKSFCYKDTCPRMFIAALFTIVKIWNQLKCPSTLDWTGKMYIYTMEYSATDTRTENQTLHVLTHRRVFNNENTWTQGGEHHTLGSVGSGKGLQQGGWGGRRGITWVEMPDVGDGWMEAANHIAMCEPMQQYCVICTCTLEPSKV